MENYKRPILTDTTEYIIKLNEALRPASELDLRSFQVLFVSIALLVLSLSTKKPETIRVFGFLIDAENWLYIAIPLVIILIYWICELVVTWKLNRDRVQHLIAGLVKEARQIHDDLGNQLRNQIKTILDRTARYEQIQKNKLKETELWNWYDSEWKKIQEERNNLPPIEKYFGSEADKLDNKEKELEIEFDLKCKEEGITDFYKEIDWCLSKELEEMRKINIYREHLKQVDNLITKAKTSSYNLRIRMLLSVIMPAILAMTSIISLFIAVYDPEIIFS